MKKIDFKRILKITINTTAVAFVAFFASQCFAQSNSGERNSSSLFYKRRISTIMDYVHENYVDEVGSAKAPRHRLELAELPVGLRRLKTQPSISTTTDIQGIVVAVASFHVLGFKVLRF